MPSEQLYVISNRGQGNLQPTDGYVRPLTEQELKAKLKVGEADGISAAEWALIAAAYRDELAGYEASFIGRYIPADDDDEASAHFVEASVMNKQESIDSLTEWLESEYKAYVGRLLAEFADKPDLQTKLQTVFALRKPREYVFVPKIGGGGLVTALKALAQPAVAVTAGVSTTAAAASMLAVAAAPRKETVWVSWVGFCGLSPESPAMYFDSTTGRAKSCLAHQAASVAMAANGISAVPVFLSSELHRLHYGDGSNGILWPLNHALVPSTATASEIKAAYDLMVKAGRVGEADAPELTAAERRRLEQILVDEALLVQCQLYEIKRKAGLESGAAEGSPGFLSAGEAAVKAVYEGYKQACYRFADAALLDLVERSSDAVSQTIWVQDYQMWYALEGLKRGNPELKLGYFHHIPFPPPAVLEQFPAAKEFLQALLHADFLDFHSSLYTKNFFDCISHFFGEHVTTSTQSADGSCTVTLAAGCFGLPKARTVTVGVKPIGVDKARCMERPAMPALVTELRAHKQACTSEDLRRQRELASGKGCILPADENLPCFGLKVQEPKMFVWVGRLDHTKGLPSTMNVFFRYIKEREAWLEALATIIATDSASGHVTTIAMLLADINAKIAGCANPAAEQGVDPVLDILKLQAVYLSSFADQSVSAAVTLTNKLNEMPPAVLEVVAPPTRESVTPYKALVKLVGEKAAAQFAGYEHYFHLRTKSVPQEGMKALFDESDVVFVPVYPADGYNLVVAEAVCSRKPDQGTTVVVCDGAGVANQVKPEAVGGPGAIVVTTRDDEGRPILLAAVEAGMLQAMKRAVKKTPAEKLADTAHMRAGIGDIKDWGAACTAPVMAAAQRVVPTATAAMVVPRGAAASTAVSHRVTYCGGETPLLSTLSSARSAGNLLTLGPGSKPVEFVKMSGAFPVGALKKVCCSKEVDPAIRAYALKLFNAAMAATAKGEAKARMVDPGGVLLIDDEEEEEALVAMTPSGPGLKQ